MIRFVFKINSPGSLRENRWRKEGMIYRVISNRLLHGEDLTLQTKALTAIVG